jgi:hypothetical protein
MVKIVSFRDALNESSKYKKRHLLLGNGFSIACDPRIFTYGSLYEQAKSNHFSTIPEVVKMFEVLGTKDFEIVLHALENAAKILPIFDPAAQTIVEKILRQASELKTALVHAIAGNHPTIPNNIEDSKFWACRSFLSHFLGQENDGKVYTSNYDLLLYWTGLHDDQPFGDSLQLKFNDGFGYEKEMIDYVTWQGESNARDQRVHYLHGAIHLFDAGTELKKYTWNGTGIPLLKQARDAMEKGMFPLFVAEGNSEQKLAKIKHSAYLYHAYKSFSSQMDQKEQALFIFGHSFTENDNHILKKISEGKVAHIFVSIFGLPTDKGNETLIERVNRIVRQREGNQVLQVTFFDADSAKIWGDRV